MAAFRRVLPPLVTAASLLAVFACRADRAQDPVGGTSLVPAKESLLVVEPGAGARGSANTPPRLVLRTTPALDTSTTPPTLSGEAPFNVQLNLCPSEDSDLGDSLNWQFNFGDSGRPAFNADGTFNPDADHICRVEHSYREGTWTATLSVTDKHLEDQGRSGNVRAAARTNQLIRIVAGAKAPAAEVPQSAFTNQTTPVTSVPGGTGMSDDAWCFTASPGTSLTIVVDTVSAATAFDIEAAVSTEATTSSIFATGDDNQACTFPPPAFACPSIVTTLPADTNGDGKYCIWVGSGSGGGAFAGPNGDYRLTVNANPAIGPLVLTLKNQVDGFRRKAVVLEPKD